MEEERLFFSNALTRPATPWGLGEGRQRCACVVGSAGGTPVIRERRADLVGEGGGEPEVWREGGERLAAVWRRELVLNKQPLLPAGPELPVESAAPCNTAGPV